MDLFLPLSFQLTGTPPGLSWSSQGCRALRASLLASCPSHTSLPLKGSTAPLLQESCFSSPVSYLTWVFSPDAHIIIQVYTSRTVEVMHTLSSVHISVLCPAGYGHLHWSDNQLPGKTLWWLALLLVLHTGLGGHAYDLLCRWERSFVAMSPEINFIPLYCWYSIWHRVRHPTCSLCLLQVSSTYVPTECVNAGEEPVHARGRQTAWLLVFFNKKRGHCHFEW